MADYLHDLLRSLDRVRRSARVRTYRIPALWHRWNYAGRMRRIGKEIAVDPYDYLRACIERAILPAMPGRGYGGRSLSQIRRGRRSAEPHGRTFRRGGDWIRAGTLYGLMVRTTTAWDHDGDGRLESPFCTESGTFLKSILLLPLLRRMGATIIYLLPVSQHSDLFRKGELGCPYAARNFTRLEPRLHDRLLGNDDALVELEFGAFVEAAHRMGMRVLVDLAPRTAARDHDWVIEHPDWFYWINARCAERYRAPRIPGVKYYNPNPARLHEIYAPPAVREHLAMFRFAPSVTDPDRWRRFRADAVRRRPDNLLDAIARDFGVITPPGFSDVINDPQPPWSDVTYLRMYLDHPAAAVKHLPDPRKQPPYVLFDVAKASLCPGRRPNRPLWEALAGILPYYQRFGVDGARLDMAHALPGELERMILDRPRRTDPDFCFMAEELDSSNHAKLRRTGYNAMLGAMWWVEPRAHQGKLHEALRKTLPSLSVPLVAAAETPDTPRAATRRGGVRFARSMAVLNNFLPNAIPFINSGLECLERQPMNLGLDAKPRDRFALPKSDPWYGKLTFFDPYVLHWTHEGAEEMVELLAEAAQLRRRYLKYLLDPKRFFNVDLRHDADALLAFGWRLGREPKALLIVAETGTSGGRPR